MKDCLIFSALALQLLLGTFLAKAQNHDALVSLGYGFPSILRFALSNANINEANGYYKIQEVKGVGPVHPKLEYIYKQRIGICASAVFNTLTVNYSNKFLDTFQLAVQEQVVGGRINVYLLHRRKHQVYIGGGIGYIDFYNLTTRTSNIHDTFNQRFQPISSFTDHTTFEATLGYRGFFAPHLGIFAEMGTGKTLRQFRKEGFIDSWLQAGVCWRLNTWKPRQALFSKQIPKPKKEQAEVIQ